jgi:hypothetical protein
VPAAGLTRLLSRIAPQEQAAVELFRTRMAALHRARRGGASRRAIKDRWFHHIRALEGSSVGTPQFDRYCQRQRARRQAWKENRWASPDSPA